MSISNYTELQAAVSAWMHRADLAARVPDFIRMGEAVLNRKLRTANMETRATASMPVGTRYMGLPAGFLEMQSIYITSQKQEVVFVESSAIHGFLFEPGCPEYFTLKDEIEFNREPDSAYPLEMHYFKRYDIASDGTNWLLTGYPEMYLYASIVSASVFIKDDSRLSTIKSLLVEGIDEINKQEAIKRGNQMLCLRVDGGL